MIKKTLVIAALLFGAYAIADNYTYIQGPTLIESLSTTATAGGTTNLLFSSNTYQEFTGTLNQTVVLPNATTLKNGRRFHITNNSTGTLTVQNFGASTLKTLPGGTLAEFILVSNATSNGTWSDWYNIPNGSIPFANSSGALAHNQSNLFWDNSTNRLGVRTSTPSQAIAIGGQSTAILRLERNKTANTAGEQFSIRAGGATAVIDGGATDKAGGALVLQSGESTGTGGGSIIFQTYTASAISSSAENLVTTKFTIGNRGNLVSVVDRNGGTSLTPWLLDNYGSFDPAIWRSANGTLASRTKTLSGDRIVGFSGRGCFDDGLGSCTFSADNARIDFVASEEFNTSTNVGTRMSFFTTRSGTSGVVEKMRIGGDGTVSIGTTSPSAQLTVAGDDTVLAVGTSIVDAEYVGAVSTPSFFRARRAKGTLASKTAVLSGDRVGALLASGFDGASYSASTAGIEFIANQDFTAANQGMYMRFLTAADNTNARTEKVRITGAGLVGIGTTAPATTSQLTIAGDAATLDGVVSERYGTSLHTHFVGHSGRGTVSAPTQTLNGDRIMALLGSGRTDTGARGAGVAGIHFLAADNFTAATQPSNMVFLTTPSGSTTRTERMRLRSDGRLGLGTTSPGGLFHILDTTGGANFADGYGAQGRFIYRRANGSPGAETAVTDGQTVASLASRGAFAAGSFHPSDGASVSFIARETYASGAQGTKISFFTAKKATVAAVERLFVDEDGTIHLKDLAVPTPTLTTGEMAYYQSGSRFVISYNDAGTVRYKYLDMAGTGVTWVHTTTAP